MTTAIDRRIVHLEVNDSGGWRRITSFALASAWTPPPDFNKPPAKAFKSQPAPAEPQPVRYTRGPSYTHDPRYQVGAGDPVPALFSALPVGRYLEE